jgi:creatinine deaminase
MGEDPFLDAAVAEARAGRDEGGIPIGSVLVIEVQDGSVVLHAEMDCLERAGRRPAADYRRATLYSTLSPCDMCSGAVLLYGIPRVVIGEHRTLRGPEDHLVERGVDVQVVDDPRCVELMDAFIAANHDLWMEDIGEPA